MKALIVVVLLAARLAEASKGCHEVSDVVGRQKCSFFGTWSRDAAVPPLWLEVGFLSRKFDAMPFNLDKQPTALLERDPRLATTMYGTTMRVLLGSIVYGGLELDAAWDGRMPQALGATQPASGLYMGAGAVIGAHVALWRIGFGAELVSGGRVAGFSACANSKDCPDAGELQARWLLDTRARLDLFAVPRFSIGAVIGHSLIDAHDTTLMISVGFHIRALDGMP